jgi:hypothetical protein
MHSHMTAHTNPPKSPFKKGGLGVTDLFIEPPFRKGRQGGFVIFRDRPDMQALKETPYFYEGFSEGNLA